MVDPTRLRSLLDRVERDIARLEAVREHVEDPALLDGAKYRLVTAIEGLTGAARHVIASAGLRGPETYADTFAVLAEAGRLAPEIAVVGQRMARFRNVLVHGYAEVDDDQVRTIVAHRLTDLRRLAEALADQD